MLDITKPVRHIGNDTATVKIIAQLEKAEDFRNKAMLVIVTTDSTGAQRIGYRNVNGSHPNNYPGLDLVNVDVSAAAAHIQTQIDQVTFNAIRNLWQTDGYKTVALDAALNKAKGVDRRDMAHYLNGLWG